jgi:hypothetical protein
MPREPNSPFRIDAAMPDIVRVGLVQGLRLTWAPVIQGLGFWAELLRAAADNTNRLQRAALGTGSALLEAGVRQFDAEFASYRSATGFAAVHVTVETQQPGRPPEKVSATAVLPLMAFPGRWFAGATGEGGRRS